MKLLTIICGICFVLLACSAPNKDQASMEKKTLDSSVTNDSLPFPLSWKGDWQGTLDIFKDNHLVQSVPMALEIKEIDSSENFVWAITYGEDEEAGRRPYELEIIDTAKGQYRIDEKNSILLESYLHNNKLVCWYQVMDNQILSIYEKTGNNIIFEIIFGSSEPASITGGQKYKGEDIPSVKTFPVGGYQRAVLTKK